jgi:hypothetical protein
MYSKASWGGDVDPFILITFMKQEKSDNVLSLGVYEYQDYELLGRVVSHDDGPEVR